MNADTILRELVEQKQSCSDVDWAAAFEWADAKKAAPPATQPEPCAHIWKVTHMGVTYSDSRCDLCGETRRSSWD